MLGNWISQTTTSTGTGNLTLVSTSGFPTFNDIFGVTEYFWYQILDDATGAPLESGIGHLSNSTTLVRDRVVATYTSSTYDNTTPTAVTLPAGTKRVICSIEENATMPSIPAVQGSFGQKLIVPDGLQLGANTKNIGTNTAFLYCSRWACSSEITALACQVTTLAGTGTDRIQIGIYATDHNGLPGSLIARTGDIAPNTTGFKSASLIGGNLRLPPGWYWWAIASNVAPVVTAGSAGGQNNSVLASPMGATAGGVNTRYSFFTASITSGWTALPSSLTLAGATSITADFPPTIGALVA